MAGMPAWRARCLSARSRRAIDSACLTSGPEPLKSMSLMTSISSRATRDDMHPNICSENAMAIPNSSDILQAVIGATPDAIFVKDLEGRYVLVNDAAAQFVGRRPQDVIGKNDLELYPEETARRFMKDDQEVLASG